MKLDATSFYRYFPVSRRDRHWGLYATTVGEARIPPGVPYLAPRHPKGYSFDWQHGRSLKVFALVYISAGRGKFECRPRASPAMSANIEAGCAFLLFPGVWHRYEPDPQTGWNEHWVAFDGETARRWQRRKFLLARRPVQSIKAGNVMLASFASMIEAVRANRPALQQILAGMTASLLGQFYSAQQTQPAGESQRPDAIETALARIQRDAAQELDMERLAQELGISYSWFRHVFARHTGLSPHQYLLEIRLLRALSLLADTDLSVKEIAAQAGFDDQNYFSRIFRQKMKLTPSDWRRPPRP